MAEVGKSAVSQWFSETANWLAIFVRTRDEQKIANRLQEKLDYRKYKVFVPTRDYAYTKNKATVIIKKPLFNGYLFIAAMVEVAECLKTIEPLFYRDPHIYKLLTNDGQGSVCLSEKDKMLMTALLDADFNMQALEAVVEGDKVRVNDGVFVGFDAYVVRVNKRRRTAIINMLFAGNRMDCEVALELIIPEQKYPLNQ